ncbi:MAG TPA: DUF6542 domain-containing protein [Streptosporangiaceae bacterium]|nr:DUF6542 domain-containing protein [Streptosporangiaceae bacterium]
MTAASRGAGLAEPFPAGEAAGPARTGPGQATPAWRGATAAAADRMNAGRGTFPPKDGQPGRAYVTARGAIVAMITLFLACDLVAGWMHVEVITGLGYAGGCLILPSLVRRNALLQVVVAPPAVFLATLLLAQALTAQGSSRHGRLLSVLEGTVLTLAAIAPWLLAGTALAVGSGLRRGLRQSVRDVCTELRAARAAGPARRG